MKSRLGGGVSGGVEEKSSPQPVRTQLTRYVRQPTSVRNTTSEASDQVLIAPELKLQMEPIRLSSALELRSLSVCVAVVHLCARVCTCVHLYHCRLRYQTKTRACS